VLVVGIKSKEDLARFIAQESLVETKPSLVGISNILEVKALYFGVGLCNGVPMLSAGLPVDILSMVLSGEQISASKHILVADTHAITNGFDAQPVNKLAGQYQETLQRAIENLGFDSWQVVRVSEINQNQSYIDFLKIIEVSHEYTKRELADMCWFNKEHGVNLKIGWALNGTKNSDETSFDRKFQLRFNTLLGFVYVTPNRTFDPKRLHSAPYFCTNPEERILLQRGEDVTSKIASAQERFGQYTTRPYKKFLSQIVRLYDRTAEKTERGEISYRLQQVIDRCTK